MSNPESNSTKPLYADIPDAELGVPIIYFDGASCHGTVGGAIQVEVIARILIPMADGSVDFKAVPTARLRCSPSGAQSLLSSLDGALKMAAQPQQKTAAASTLN
jgi:hypothetical protein